MLDLPRDAELVADELVDVGPAELGERLEVLEMRLDLLEVGVRVRASPSPSQVCASTCLKLG